MKSLKDQLLQAGLKPSTTPKSYNERENISKKKMTETISHQTERNFCEECQQVRPDVEFYRHKNPTTEAEWICLKCADQLKILDTCRQSAQSQSSIKNMFKREFGLTVRADEIRSKFKK